MSVHLSSRLERLGMEPADLVIAPGEGLVAIRVGDLREAEMGVDFWPFEHEPAHAIVFSLKGPKRSASQQKRTGAAATWVVKP